MSLWWKPFEEEAYYSHPPSQCTIYIYAYLFPCIPKYFLHLVTNEDHYFRANVQCTRRNSFCPLFFSHWNYTFTYSLPVSFFCE